MPGFSNPMRTLQTFAACPSVIAVVPGVSFSDIQNMYSHLKSGIIFSLLFLFLYTYVLFQFWDVPRLTVETLKELAVCSRSRIMESSTTAVLTLTATGYGVQPPGITTMTTNGDTVRVRFNLT